jgi:Xaa-Pro aminopeptidase
MNLGCVSGQGWSWRVAALLLLAFCALVPAMAQQRREREPNSVYAERRAKLASNIDGPVVLLGYTGHEVEAQTYIFAQEENFYYLTGHNEEEAALVLLPPDGSSAKKDDWAGPREIFFLPAKNPSKEKWNGVRMSPSDPGIETRTGFALVKELPELRATVERLAKFYPAIYTILPYEHELGGYPHEKETVDWLKLAAPQAALKDIRGNINDRRVVKSPTELSLLRQAINLSLDAHFEAMKMMRPGLFEYQVAAKMEYVHAMGGAEDEAYAPIVGAGLNSTVLHYDKLFRKIEDGDMVLMDVAAQYAGYAADITRTVPANGKYTPRQREIYDIVLGAQNAAIDAVRPGAVIGCREKHEKKDALYNIAYNYINTHGKDLHGKPLGQYFIHGLGHSIGLNVHDPGLEGCKPLAPGMVVTMEPGIYIPEENLGVRIEDDVLVTASGHELLSQKLPRNPAEIEKIMAEAARQRAAAEKSPIGQKVQSPDSADDATEIRALIAEYAKSISEADTALGSEIWSDSPDVSFIHPRGEAHGWDEIKRSVYEDLMGGFFSQRDLQVRDVVIRVYGDAAWAEFNWHFDAKWRSDGSAAATDGRETQIYRRGPDGRWRLVHVHYSGLPVTAARQGV